ncbi:hypothetical protein DL769_001431 [Monosporascus sp. CRB-8-3]|nr:hypothetical protein DL769_001431 [Monosporascus sp. CRB-8-3]
MRTRRTKQPAQKPGVTNLAAVAAAVEGGNGDEAAKTTSATAPTPAPPASPTVVKISKIETPTKTPTKAQPSEPTSSSPSRSLAKPKPSASSSSKLPAPLRFPLVATLSLSLCALGYAIAYSYTDAVIAAFERPLETWTEVGLVFGWRILELALGWFGNYDSYDLAAMNVLSHGPPVSFPSTSFLALRTGCTSYAAFPLYNPKLCSPRKRDTLTSTDTSQLYLLYAFYEVPAAPLLLSLAIETLATYLPFRLLRPLSAAHATPSQAPNAEIVADRPIALLTTLLAGAIYSVTLFCAYATYLPTYLVMYFADLPSLVAAHESTWVGLLPATLALGVAARVFVFTPAEATTPTSRQREQLEKFDPAAAGLAETLRWNVWGWSAPTKVVIRRTTLLVLLTGVNAFLGARYGVRGVETPGAIAWASVWVAAAALTGGALGAVGSV